MLLFNGRKNFILAKKIINSTYFLGNIKFGIKNFSVVKDSGCLFIKPKLYADFNLNKDKEYYDFESMNLSLGY
jgi:hypothetical protein